MIENRRSGKKVLFRGGPAIIHTGAGKYLEALIVGGWIDVLFAGNAPGHSRHRSGAAGHVPRRQAVDGCADGQRAQPPSARDQLHPGRRQSSGRPWSRAC
jgi:hypothetical protein